MGHSLWLLFLVVLGKMSRLGCSVHLATVQPGSSPINSYAFCLKGHDLSLISKFLGFFNVLGPCILDQEFSTWLFCKCFSSALDHSYNNSWFPWMPRVWSTIWALGACFALGVAADRDFDSMAAGVARGKAERNKCQKWIEVADWGISMISLICIICWKVWTFTI